MQSSPVLRSRFLRTAVDAMTLRDEVFRAPRDDPKAFGSGLVFVVAVSLIVALAGLGGAVLTQWTSPDMAALRSAVTEGVLGLPWLEQVPADVRPEVERQMQQNMDFVWRIIEAVAPSAAGAVVNLVLQPLGALLFWLLFGLVAHLCARLLAGTATLAQTYGATALAVAPQLLGVVNLLPYVQTAGLATWSLVCTYVALKQVHGLSPGRALWATLLPFALFLLLVVMIGAGIAAAVVLAIAAVGGVQ